MKIKCRLYKREGTEKEIDHDDYTTAPGEYAYRYVKFDEPGSVSFVEVFQDEEWKLWEVECQHPGFPLILFTKQATREEVDQELRQFWS